jgi:hypothetical protein
VGKRAGPPCVSSLEGETVRSYGVPEAATLACRGLTRLILGPAVELDIAEPKWIALLFSGCCMASCATPIVGVDELLETRVVVRIGVGRRREWQSHADVPGRSWETNAEARDRDYTWGQ